jgi:phosphoribosylaminoimidazole (AIR) synthetase
MKCIDCRRKKFIGFNLVCSVTQEIIVSGNEPMELLKYKECYLSTKEGGKNNDDTNFDQGN